jgi:mono/diheme cytochrome c family protein
MKLDKQKFTISLASLLAVVLMFAFTVPQQKKGEAWDIPAKYKNMKNPHQGDKSLLRVGKSIYVKHCASCHGKSGLGDGSKAANLKTYPGDFSSDEFQSYKDGEIYYMSFIGRNEMPNFEKKIEYEEDRWAVINYIRTMK